MNKLIKAINEVKATVKDETYGVDPNVQVFPPQLVFPIKVTIQTSALETGTYPNAFNYFVKDISTL